MTDSNVPTRCSGAGAKEIGVQFPLRLKPNQLKWTDPVRGPYPGLHERDRAGQSADDTVFSVACLAHRRRSSPLARKPAFLATRLQERWLFILRTST
mgnify:CR=1 FL=1